MSSLQGSTAISREEQAKWLNVSQMECRYRVLTETPPEGTHCPMTFDGLLCWNYTPPDVAAKQSCPSYVEGFNSSAFASRLCLDNGTWFVHPEKQHSWTNYSDCYTHASDMSAEHANLLDMQPFVEKIKLMQIIGYSLSLASLAVAVVILVSCRRLHCPRNNIHINLFASFIMRAVMLIVMRNMLVDGLGLSRDVVYGDTGEITFIEGASHWQCKLLICTWHYCIMCNYFWILMEGLYIHNLIFFSMSAESSGVLCYIFCGWGAPFFCVVPWAIVRYYFEDTYCWNTHETQGYFWIIRGPITATILINFVFFINIVRILFTKLRVPTDIRTAGKQKYKRLAKSTLVLLPLFGIHYMLLIGMANTHHATAVIVWLFIDQFFSSFQGFFVALLFCFLNGEVQAELKKRWQRHRLRSGHFTENCGSKTTFSIISRYRPSMSVEKSEPSMMGKPMLDANDVVEEREKHDHRISESAV